MLKIRDPWTYGASLLGLALYWSCVPTTFSVLVPESLLKIFIYVDITETFASINQVTSRLKMVAYQNVID